VVRFSPDSMMLAVGGHDNYIDIYKDRNTQTNATFRFVKRLMGHASYITALDWSLDGRLLQSTDGGYELLYWDVEQGKLAQSKHAKPFGDVRWLTRSCTLGFDVMGIWPDASDGTDINSLATSTPGFNASNLLAATSAIFDEDEDGPSEMESNVKNFAVVPNSDRKPSLLVTGDDYGGVKVFNYPCVANDAPFYRLNGHSSHVTSVRFLGDEQRVVTAGGRDHTLLQWKVVPSSDRTWFPDGVGNGYTIKQDKKRSRLRSNGGLL